MTQVLAFLAIFGTANAALFGLGWASIVVGALILWSISLYEHRRNRARFAAAGMTDVFQNFALSNVGVSVMACCGAYLLGSVVRQIAF